MVKKSDLIAKLADTESPASPPPVHAGKSSLDSNIQEAIDRANGAHQSALETYLATVDAPRRAFGDACNSSLSEARGFQEAARAFGGFSSTTADFLDRMRTQAEEPRSIAGFAEASQVHRKFFGKPELVGWNAPSELTARVAEMTAAAKARTLDMPFLVPMPPPNAVALVRDVVRAVIREEIAATGITASPKSVTVDADVESLKDLPPAVRNAYQLWKFGQERDGTLRTDADIYGWLASRPEYAERLMTKSGLMNLRTFSTYVGRARRILEGPRRRRRIVGARSAAAQDGRAVADSEEDRDDAE